MFRFRRKYFLFFIKCFTDPIPSPSFSSIRSAILTKPVIFDLVTLYLQYKDGVRTQQLTVPIDDTSDKAKAIRHNLIQIQEKLVTRSRRVEPALQIAVMPYRNTIKDEKVLCIGCRNILEIHQATLFGFSWKNITGLDLFSVNPKIKEGAMENIPFEDESFDLVTNINTLAYSGDPMKALDECVRVLKPGGRFVLTHPFNLNDPSFTSPYSKDKLLDLACTIGIKEYTRKLIQKGLRMYYTHSHDKVNSIGTIQTAHVIAFVKTTERVQDDLFEHFLEN